MALISSACDESTSKRQAKAAYAAERALEEEASRHRAEELKQLQAEFEDLRRQEDKLLAQRAALAKQLDKSREQQETNTSADTVESLRLKLEEAHHAAGEDNISCKAAVEAETRYIGCRRGGDSDAATVWYVDGSTVKALNGEALQMVPKLKEPWIQEAPRPAPAGISIESGLGVTK